MPPTQERRQHEAILEALEQEAVAVGAHHAREVVSDGAEGGDEQVNLLGPEAALGQPERGENDERRADDEHEVAPRIEDPEQPASGDRALRQLRASGTCQLAAHVSATRASTETGDTI